MTTNPPRERGRPALPLDEQKVKINITLDRDLLKWIEKQGKNRSRTINKILRQERNATMTIDEIRIVPTPGGIAVEWYEDGTVVKSKTYADKTKAENAAYKAGVTHRCPVGDWTKAE